MQLFRTDNKLTPSWSLVSPSIELLKSHSWQVFYLAFLPGLVSLAGFALVGMTAQPSGENFVFDGRSLSGLVLAVVGTIWSLITYPGYLYLQTRAVRGQHPTAMECFRKGLPKLLPFIWMAILSGFALAAGFILFIIPGLILLRGIYLAQYYLIDRDLSAIEALKKSWAESKPNAGYIWGTIGVEALVGIVASALQKIPVIGYLISLAVGFVFAFGSALRYEEVTLGRAVIEPAADRV